MNSPQILVIDDSMTILKMVECHLTQAGYRVVTTSSAEEGIAAAARLCPDLILLDHQLPGTTGDVVCRQLLASESTARIPVVISSAMRSRAFVAYADFPNVVDQIPKPFTPDLLRTGVANALEVGSLVIRAQATGCTMPEVVNEGRDTSLRGESTVFPVREVLDFLNNGKHEGRLTVEVRAERIRFALGAGRIQAVVSPTPDPSRLATQVPDDLQDLSPLLAVTLGERMDPSMAGLVKLLERSLTDPRRLRRLLRAQSAILTYEALTSEAGEFEFESGCSLPPMFNALPLQLSLPALAIEGVRYCTPMSERVVPDGVTYAKQNLRGGNVDRSGLSSVELRVLALLDGKLDHAGIAARVGLEAHEAWCVLRGLELCGLAARQHASEAVSILVIEEHPEAIQQLQLALATLGACPQVRFVRDKVGAQLLLRRQRFEIVLLGLERPDLESIVRSLKVAMPETTRLVGIGAMGDEEEIKRLDGFGFDGVLQMPVVASDIREILGHLTGRSVDAVLA